MKRRGLGRGLEALIPEVERAAPAASEMELDIDRISPNPEQPRLHLDEAKLEELAASIRENGVLQPVLVRPHAGGFQLIAGERRVAAAQRAGLLRVPAVVRDVPDEKMLEQALIENIQREQLNPIEEAQAYQRLLGELHATQEELAARLGKERSTIANSVRLLKLPPAVRDLIAAGKLSPGHARALLAADLPAAELTSVAQRMAQQSWSVREAERWAKSKVAASPPQRPRDPDESAAEDRLRTAMGTKVEIRPGRSRKGSGHIRIYYFSSEDLDRIYGMLTK